MVIKLDSHIKAEQKDGAFIFEGTEIIEPNLTDLNRSFYKAPRVTHTQQGASAASAKTSAQQTAPVRTKQVRKNSNLEYVGSGGSSKNGRYIFLKDKTSGELYKLPLTESGDGDWCKELSFSSYEVHLKDEIYEVRK